MNGYNTSISFKAVINIFGRGLSLAHVRLWAREGTYSLGIYKELDNGGEQQ